MTRRAKLLGVVILAMALLMPAFGVEAAQTTNAPAAQTKTSTKKTAKPPADTEALGKASRPRIGTKPGARAQAAPAGQNADAPKVAVLPFEVNAGPAQDKLNDELPAMLAQRLLGKGIAVVPESAVLAQMRKDGVKTLTIQVARTIAAKLGAAAAVYGSYSQVGNAFSIDARFVEVGDAQIVKPIFVERANAAELLPGVDELATRISNEIKRRDLIAAVEVRGTKVLDSDVC